MESDKRDRRRQESRAHEAPLGEPWPRKFLCLRAVATPCAAVEPHLYTGHMCGTGAKGFAR